MGERASSLLNKMAGKLANRFCPPMRPWKRLIRLLCLSPLPIKGLNRPVDFPFDGLFFQILPLVAVSLSTPDTEFQFHSVVFPIEPEGD